MRARRILARVGAPRWCRPCGSVLRQQRCGASLPAMRARRCLSTADASSNGSGEPTSSPSPSEPSVTEHTRLWSEGHTQDAWRSACMALAKNPSDVSLLEDVAEMSAAMQLWEAGLHANDAIVKLIGNVESNWPKRGLYALLRSATCSQNVDDDEGAQAKYERALTVSPAPLLPMVHLQRAWNYWERATAYPNAKAATALWTEALVSFNHALESTGPDTPEIGKDQLANVHFGRASAHFHLEEWDAAIEAASQALDVDSMHAPSYHKRGEARQMKATHILNGKVVGVNRVQPNSKEREQGHTLVAQALQDYGKVSEHATEFYSQFSSLSLKNVDGDALVCRVLLNQGHCHLMLGDPSMARRMFVMCYSMGANQPHIEALARHSHGVILWEQDKPWEALEHVTAALELSPDLVSARLLRAKIYDKADRPAEAQEDRKHVQNITRARQLRDGH